MRRDGAGGVRGSWRPASGEQGRRPALRSENGGAAVCGPGERKQQASLRSRVQTLVQARFAMHQRPAALRRHSVPPAVPFLLAVATAAAAISAVSGADPVIVATMCGPTPASDPETFDVSFVNALELIYQNVTRSGFGTAFSSSSPGSGTGDNNSSNSSVVVYGLGQCSRVKLPRCLPSTAGRIFLDGCFLRYGAARRDFSADPFSPDSDTAVCSSSNNSNRTRAASFAGAAAGLLRNVTDAAPGGEGYYSYGAAGAGTGDGEERVYAAAQCWRSLNATACGECVASARSSGGVCPAPFFLPSDANANANAGGASSSSTRHVIIVVVVASVFSAAAVLGIAYLWTRMRPSSGSDDLRHDDHMDGSGEIIRAIAASQLGFRYEELRSATDGFNQINKLGQGSYGSVYKGMLADGREIAVKRLFFHTRQWAEQFYNEVRMVSQVQHKNLVKLLGCSVDGPESLLKNALDWERRSEIVLCTAEGLSYLHNASEIRIIHKDIKASNVASIQ
ncbi:LOW QUALITY PROTEIN: hypothetical protein BRADI_2g38413v3, partial [Brachypodium distachyon]